MHWLMGDGGEMISTENLIAVPDASILQSHRKNLMEETERASTLLPCRKSYLPLANQVWVEDLRVQLRLR